MTNPTLDRLLDRLQQEYPTIPQYALDMYRRGALDMQNALKKAAQPQDRGNAALFHPYADEP